MNGMKFEPKIVAFVCNWCSYAAADLAGVSRIQYPTNVVNVKMMCSGRIDPLMVIDAFIRGADGVLVSGCHPGDCHYIHGNYLARRRLYVLKKLLVGIGIETERFRIEWISASESQRYSKVIEDMVKDIKRLGPLELSHGDEK